MAWPINSSGHLLAGLEQTAVGHRHGGEAKLVRHLAAALADALLHGPEPVARLVRSSRPRSFQPPGRPRSCGCSQAPSPARVAWIRLAGSSATVARRQQRLLLVLPEAHHAGVEDDVGIEDLAGQRIGARRPHGEAAVGGDPAEGVVVDVLRIEVLVLLLAHLDGVAEADLLERLVPFQDALADGGAILVRHRLLDPEDDLLLRGRQLVLVLRIGVGPLQPPAIDVAEERGVAVVGAEVLDDAEEVADAVVGQARLIAVLGQQRQAVVDDDRGAAAVDDAVVPAKRPPAKVAATSSSMFFGNALTLCQLLRLGSKPPRPSSAKSLMKMSLRSMTTPAAAG